MNNSRSKSGLRSTASASFNPSTLRQPLPEAGLPVTQRASVGSSLLPLFLHRAGAPPEALPSESFCGLASRPPEN